MADSRQNLPAQPPSPRPSTEQSHSFMQQLLQQSQVASLSGTPLTPNSVNPNNTRQKKGNSQDELHVILMAPLRRHLSVAFPHLEVDANAAAVLQSLCDKVTRLILSEAVLAKKKKKGEMDIIASDLASVLWAIEDLRPLYDKLSKKGLLPEFPKTEQQIKVSDIVNRELRDVHSLLLVDQSASSQDESPDEDEHGSWNTLLFEPI